MTELIETELSSFEEAVEKPMWVDAMVEEYESIVKNSVWVVVLRPVDKLVVDSRWIFKVKHAADGSIEKIDNYLTSLGFTKSEADTNLYHILVEGKLLIIVLYVYDLILIGDEKLIKSCKEDIAREFEMKDMGLLHYFIRLGVWQGDEEHFVSQGKYANEILHKFHMDSCKPMETPLATSWRKEDVTSSEEVDATNYRQLVGSVMYLVNT
eukprot:PITA_33612